VVTDLVFEHIEFEEFWYHGVGADAKVKDALAVLIGGLFVNEYV